MERGNVWGKLGGCGEDDGGRGDFGVVGGIFYPLEIISEIGMKIN